MSEKVWSAYELLMQAKDEVGETGCESYPEAFFPEDSEDRVDEFWKRKEAKKLCEACPMKMQCLEYALEADERYGIWGGLTYLQRRKLSRGNRNG